MKRLLLAGSVLLGTLTIASFRAPAPEGLEKGTKAPELNVKTWFNHIGRPLNLESLRGQAVMLEFWATWCGPCVAAWPHVQEIHNEYRDKGLVVLALSNEEDAKVRGFLDQNGYTVPTAAGCTAGTAYGVSGIPRTFLIDPEGNIAWNGHPSELSKGLIADVLKNAKKRPSGFMAVPLETEPTGKLAPVGKLLSQGSPGKALPAAQAIAEDAKSTEAERTEAQGLVKAIQEHAQLLRSQADAFIASKDVITGLSVLDALGKEFTGEIGDGARKRADEIRKDAGLAKEIAGAEALAKAQDAAAKLGTSKAKGKFQEVIDKYKGTKAAERAQAILRAKK